MNFFESFITCSEYQLILIEKCIKCYTKIENRKTNDWHDKLVQGFVKHKNMKWTQEMYSKHRNHIMDNMVYYLVDTEYNRDLVEYFAVAIINFSWRQMNKRF
ncbi:MAG: hypothetical protein ACTSVW_02820 [Candidatus Njordarchaeales archaeon]